MAVPSTRNNRSQPASSFDIKSAQLSLVSLVVKHANLSEIAGELLEKFGPQGESPDFFDNDLLVLDVSQLLEEALPLDMAALLQALAACHLKPIAIRTESQHYLELGKVHGLAQAPAEPVRKASAEPSPDKPGKLPEIVREVTREVIRDVPAASTLVIDKPLRSGQKVYARGADLVVLAMVNPGAEVAADGNIHVYAPLRGKAMAGASGNVNARIFSLCLEAELISIAGVYRTSENPLPPSVLGKSAQVRLSNDGQEKLLIEALKP